MTPAAVASPLSPSADGALSVAQAATCAAVRDGVDRSAYFAIRRQVFVAEQRIFAVSDRDERDASPDTLHALAWIGGVAVGTVRLYSLDDDGLWKGDRLAVLPAYRRRHVGAPLVRFAVSTAAARGGRRMIAYIQPPNVAFFARLGWRPVGQVVRYCGRPHQPMAIDLGRWGQG